MSSSNNISFVSRRSAGIAAILTCLQLCGIATLPLAAFAEERADSSEHGFQIAPRMFFDSRSSGFSQNSQQQNFKGEVVAVGAGVMMSADEILVDHKAMTLLAKGHVLLISGDQIFTGTKLFYNLENGHFLIDDAQMITGDKQKNKEVTQKILGFTPQELEFEAKRKLRLQEISEKKETLKGRFKKGAVKEDEPLLEQLIDEYALNLEQEEVVSQSENPALANMGSDRRLIFENRRAYWESQQKLVPAKNPKAAQYFKLVGSSLERLGENDYQALEATWTACECGENEKPSWAFSADQIDAQPEGYVDMFHAIFEIKGIPILYLPYVKLPIKSTRQSGFLMPVIDRDFFSGNIYSQPLFLALGDRQDATLLTEIHENRGTKLGLEWRFQDRKSSGWTLNVEGMRDRLWLEERQFREDVLSNNVRGRSCTEELSQAESRRQSDIELGAETQPLSPDEREAIRRACESDNFELRKRVIVPGNTWRTKKSWEGMTVLAPGLSFVSRGKVYSDHRYVEELTLPDPIRDAVDFGHMATFFAPARAQLHFDHSDFYLGVGGAIADTMSESKRYYGLQMPFKANARSRYYRVDPWGGNSAPVYASLVGRHLRMTEYLEPDPYAPPGMGAGYWQQGQVNLASPVVVDGPLGVDVFGDFEARRIVTDQNSQDPATIRSYRAGVTLKLPMIGESYFPRLTNDLSDDNESARSGLRHKMDWNFTMSTRPSVLRNGDYGNELTENKYYRTYFVSDSDPLVRLRQNDDAAREEDAMRRHQRLQLETIHAFSLFSDELQSTDKGTVVPSKGEDGEALSFLERAQEELIASLGPSRGEIARRMEGSPSGRTEFHGRNYRWHQVNQNQFLSLYGLIAYDYISAEQREEQIRMGVEERLWARPWDDPRFSIGLNLGGIALTGSGTYNLYDEALNNADIVFQLPKMLQTDLMFRLNVARQADGISDWTQFFRVTSSLIPSIEADVQLGLERDFGLNRDPIERYLTIFNLRYIAPSKCWQLNFVRSKPFQNDEKTARYHLQLDVIFMGSPRRIVDLAPAVIPNFVDGPINPRG